MPVFVDEAFQRSGMRQENCGFVILNQRSRVSTKSLSLWRHLHGQSGVILA